LGFVIKDFAKALKAVAASSPLPNAPAIVIQGIGVALAEICFEKGEEWV
jgi:hypothetical protein